MYLVTFLTIVYNKIVTMISCKNCYDDYIPYKLNGITYLPSLEAQPLTVHSYTSPNSTLITNLSC